MRIYKKNNSQESNLFKPQTKELNKNEKKSLKEMLLKEKKLKKP
jgi:hypothetical protein